MDRPSRWMWSEAIAVLARVDRLQRQDFMPSASRAAAWEPPVDMVETEGDLTICVALPGIDPETVEVRIEGADLVVAGRRALPPQLRAAVIHRLELPQGRFERRLALPPGRYDGVRQTSQHGCLFIGLRKAG